MNLCLGPHVPALGRSVFLNLLSVGCLLERARRTRCSADLRHLLSKKKALDEYLEHLEEAKRRDHESWGRNWISTVSPKRDRVFPSFTRKGW